MRYAWAWCALLYKYLQHVVVCFYLGTKTHLLRLSCVWLPTFTATPYMLYITIGLISTRWLMFFVNKLLLVAASLCCLPALSQPLSWVVIQSTLLPAWAQNVGTG